LRSIIYSLAVSSIVLSFPSLSNAIEYYCFVEVKRDYDRIYSQTDLQKWKWGVKIVDTGDNAKISRCSFSSSADAVTCDDYVADYIHSDPFTGIKKFYYFRGHFDVQLFTDLSFIENNGRGSIGRGRCRVTRP